jgi:pyruvate kinase
MQRLRRCKIIATLGPATASSAMASMNSDAKCNTWSALNRIDFSLSPGAAFASPESAQRAPLEATKADAIAIAVAARNLAETWI